MYHRIEFIGRITREPELKYTGTGKAVLNLGVAVNDRVQQNGEWVDETTFYEVSVWEATAERLAERLSKGDQVLVEGRPKVETYERKDGGTGVRNRVVFPRVTALGSKRSGGYEGASGDDEVPF
jgi:single-strand DNA-binding protein